MIKRLDKTQISRPIILITVGAVILSLLSAYANKPAVIFSAGVILLALIFIFRHSKAAVLFTLITITALSVSIFSDFNIKSNTEKLIGEKITGDFLVCSKTEMSGYNILDIRSLESNIDKKIRFCVISNDNINTGDKINAEIIIKSVEFGGYSNDIYVETRNCSVNSAVKYDSFLNLAGRLRKHIKNTLFNTLSYNEAATLCGILLGDKSMFSDEFSQAVILVGVSHIMVVSGVHLSKIMGGIFKAVNLFSRNKYIKFVIVTGTVIFISALCGFTTSILRAGIMYIVWSLSFLFERDSDSLCALCFTVLLILIFSPFAVLNLSFELSVLSTFGILVVAPFWTESLTEKFNIKNKVLIYLISSVNVTVSALVFTLPICVYKFGGVSVISILSNLLISSVMTSALVCTALALLVSVIPLFKIFAPPLFLAGGICAKYINYVINILSRPDWVYVEIDKKYAFLFAVAAFCLLFVTYACKRRKYLLKLKQSDMKVKERNGSHF